MIIWKISTLLALFVLIECGTKSSNTGTKEWLQEIIDDQADAITKARQKIVDGVKSWIIVEPTERETLFVDKAMASMFSIGTDVLIDTKKEMDEFCPKRSEYLVEIAAWVIRKYTFHINIRVFMNILLNNMRKKNDLYCADDTFKQNYLNFTQQLTQINPKLTSIELKFIDTLVAIQNSKIGGTKIPKFCCAYWRYKNDTIEAINPQIPELRAFVKDLIDSYFKDSIQLMCLPFSDKFTTICEHYSESSPRGHLRESVIMNMIDAISKMTYLIF